jgi:hypothetical protein
MTNVFRVVVLSVLVVSSVQAQNYFEGSAKWTVKIEYTDPVVLERKKQEASRLSDPAAMNQIYEMEQRMQQDPVVKAHMDSNSFMRVQMKRNLAKRKFIQEHPNEDPLTLFSPKAIIVRAKNKNYFLQMEGGAPFMYENILYDSTGRKFSINAEDKVYAEYPFLETDSSALQSRIIKTKVSEKILTYKCKKYVVETVLNGKAIKQQVWVTKKVKPFHPLLLNDLNLGGGKTGIDFTKIKGTPLKMILTNEETNIILTVTELKQEKTDASLFAVPKGYKEYQMRTPLRK